MHYNKYPYPDPEWYRRHGRKISDYRVSTVATKKTWEDWFPGEPYRPLRVLVVGCGTVEAILVALTNMDNQVTGIDASAASIEVATKIAAEEGLKNLTLQHHEFNAYGPNWIPGSPFDSVVVNGVLHHVKGPPSFLFRLRQVIADNGRMAVMVYGNYARSFIPGFCQAIAKLGLCADDDGVVGARAIIQSLPDGHPVKLFNDAIEPGPSQVTDTWLHSHFTQYSASEFVKLVEWSDFTFRRWINQDDFAATVIDGLPPELSYLRDRFHRLSAEDRWDICQVFNHNDLKITALFAPR